MQVEDSTSTPAKLTYHRRGFLVNKIGSYKRKYGLTEPTQDKYVGKSNEEVIELLKQMAVVVGKLKDAKFQDQIQSKYYSRSQTADFIYKTPIYWFWGGAGSLGELWTLDSIEKKDIKVI